MEIKNCPFCGKKPHLMKSISVYKDDRSLKPIHDIDVSWKIRCNNCGTEKKSYGSTYYHISDDGELVVVPQFYNDEEKANPSDKRLEVIEMWNKRFD